jgi:putative DeoR family transcriptional regulator (stage III sporulation protein D)
MMYIAPDKERCVILGPYIVENRATVRQAAARYGVSKSTVHKDVTETLRHVNRSLCEEVAKVLEQNKNERHLRGGEATRRRHLSQGGKK